MAYRPSPEPAPGAVRDFLVNLGSRKEFYSLHRPTTSGLDRDARDLDLWGYSLPDAGGAMIRIPGLRFHGAQEFVAGFQNPNTPYPRLLLNWQTGAGKTIAAILIAHHFTQQFRSRVGVPPADRPSVYVVGFTREVFLRELRRHPELGFISHEELLEFRRLQELAERAGEGSPEARHLAGVLGTLNRRITDRTRGGYYRFFGYKEFANRLFAITRKGQEAGFDPQTLFGGQEPLEQVLAAEEKKGNVTIDTELLRGLRGGLVIADEIHNVYNVRAKNNYGLALQYVLDRLGDEAPRAVFMSGTPLSGSAAEVVDLLNLLIPRGRLPGGRPLEKRDFFTGSGGGVQPLPNALERIGLLSAGRVSFLLDADTEAYPRRVFEGEALRVEGKEIPYLRFTPCPAASFHARTLAEAVSEEGAIASGSYSLYDMAFPNPDFPPRAPASDEGYGLYRSGETPARLSGASESWRSAAGVAVQLGKGESPAVISGPFLKLKGASGGPLGVQYYSTKYHRLGADVVEIVRGGPGKIMIYHDRVRMSGVVLIQELLRANGFADENSSPTAATLCGVCGVPRGEHAAEKGHRYVPARFVVATGDIDRSTMLRSLSRYDAPQNSEGHEFRILLGSRIIQEAFDLKAVQFLLVCSLPADISSLIQVFGRAVRKGSHLALPPEQRRVQIRVYVTTAAGGAGAGGASRRQAPELFRYAEKMKDYLVIQEVSRVLRTNAVDGFANFDPQQQAAPSLDSLGYTPRVTFADLGGPTEHTFRAYGYADREVQTITDSIWALFRARPVWTYSELWEAVREPGAVRGVAHDPRLFEEDNFALALEGLLGRPAEAGGAGRRLVNTGEFFLRVPVVLGEPIVDYESYLREGGEPRGVNVKVSDYVKETRLARNFEVRLSRFEKRFDDPGEDIEDALVDYDSEFHYSLLRLLVEADWGGDSDAHRRARREGRALQRATDLYSRFRVLLTRGEIFERPEARQLWRGEAPRGSQRERLGGYVAETAGVLYSGPGRPWQEIPLSALGLGAPRPENDIVVGYVEKLKFKIRPPLQALEKEEVPDIRSLARGAVCETRPREEQECLACRLGALNRQRSREMSSSEICHSLRDRLLELEEKERRRKVPGVRWFYLFNEKLPAIRRRN